MEKAANRAGITYFLSHPIQYFSPMLREMAKEFDLDVCYFSDNSLKESFDAGFGQKVAWDIPLLEGYQSQFLKNHRSTQGLNNRFWDVWNPGAWKAARQKGKKIIIVNGWTYGSNWLAMISARLSGREVWLRAENPLNQELRKSARVRMVKCWLLGRFLFKFLVSRCLYIGTESKKFFQYYGVPERKLCFTPYAVDNHFFSTEYEKYRNCLPQLKEQLGLPAGKKIILFSGKYIEKKRPMDLLKAFAQLNNPDYCLVMVGEGQLRGEMEKYIADNQLQHVVLTGFVNQQSIPKYYAVADVFVICSGMGETWGLVTNEAMNFGKPVVVSSTCGCSADLVQPGVNGFVFEEGDINALAAHLKEILENDAMRSKMGDASLEIIKNFSIPRIVEQLKQAAANAAQQ